MPNKKLIVIDRITSSLLQKPNSQQTRKINVMRIFSGVRFTIVDVWKSTGDVFISCLLRIDTDIVIIKGGCSHKISVFKKWNLVLIAMIYS